MPKTKKLIKTEKLPKASKTEKEFVEPVVPTAQHQHRSVASILGFKLSRYKTENVQEYNGFLREMNKIDLQRECIRVGLHPLDNRETMMERLLKEFRKFVAGNQQPPQPIPIKIGARSRNILSQSATPLV